MPSHSIKGTWCKRRLLNLHGILDQWTEIVARMGRKWNKSGDVPWWYNERADLSLFAGAVWWSGGDVLEEFSSVKRKIGKTTGRLHSSYSGRVDLYFETPNGSDYYLECKSMWSGASRPNESSIRKIEDHLEWACYDIKKFHPQRSRRLGLVFAKPYIVRSSSKVDVKKKISDWLVLMESVNCDAMAWSFPSSGKCGKSTTNYCPGVAIFIKERKK